jgi:hypothetical protein
MPSIVATRRALLNSSGSFISYGPIVDDYRVRLAAAGGAEPSAETLTLLKDFNDAIDLCAGLSAKMIAVNCFVPDNLIAACTPLIANAGNAVWTNNNFVDADLSTSGLKGNGSTKYLNTGCVPNVVFDSVDNTGVTVYSDYVNEVKCEMGSSDGTNHQRINWHVFSTTFAYEHNGDATFGAAGMSGYISCNRPAGVGNQVYRASAGFGGHVLAATSGDAAGSLNNRSLYVFCTNNSGTPSLYCSKRLRFAAVHDALTITQSACFFNAIQTLRTYLGGAV